MAKSEIEILRELGISDWSEASLEQLQHFIRLIPEVDPQVVVEVFERVPELQRMAVEALGRLEKEADSKLFLDANHLSEARVHDAFDEARQAYREELKRDDISEDSRQTLYNLILQTGERQFAKDSENKRFLDKLYGKVLAAGLVAIGVGALVVKGNASRNEDKSIRSRNDSADGEAP